MSEDLNAPSGGKAVRRPRGRPRPPDLLLRPCTVPGPRPRSFLSVFTARFR